MDTATSFWTARSFREAAGGQWLAHRPSDAAAEAELAGVSTDTRALEPGQAFVAIRGPRFDAHHFLSDAADAGAALLIVDREPANMADLPGSVAVLLVDNTLKALGRLAAAYRRTLNAEVIAVTGSVGKTTTKHLIDGVLKVALPGRASPRSFNNHIGVPLTLLSARPGDRYLVVEVGTSAPGEIAALGRIAQPDVAIITHAGPAHIEGLGSIEAVAAEKASLINHLREGGLAILNGEVDALRPHYKLTDALITYGRNESCDLRLTRCEAHDDSVDFEVNRRATFHLPMPGEHNAVNALAAVAVGRHLNLSDDQIAAGLAAVTPIDMRHVIQRYGGATGVTVINDAYNANPISMAAALEALAARSASGRRVAILGDMAELGDASASYHRQIGQRIAELPVDAAVLIGQAMAEAAGAVKDAKSECQVRHEPTFSEDLPQRVAAMLEPGDVVLIKASRAMALERLAPAIERRFAGNG